ncbi:unnamed protein product, partial [Cyprideis torosa]
GYDLDFGSNIMSMQIPAPISQVVSGKLGLYQQISVTENPMTVQQFYDMSQDPRYRTPQHVDLDDLERQYWENVTYGAPTYGADVPGTLTDTNVDVWNISRLGSILDDIDENIQGVNTPYLYFGTWKSTFPWHTEDMDLYSINYLHFGEPKFWYAVPPEHGKLLEKFSKGFYTRGYSLCPAFLRHKMALVRPDMLTQYGIPYNKVSHQFTITSKH